MEKPPMSDNDVPGPGYYQSTQPQPPKKKRRGLRIAAIGCGGLIALVVIIIIIIIIIAAVAAGTHNATTTGTATGAAPPASASASTHAASLGNPVRDGKFQFTVTSVSSSNTAGDPAAGGETAQGEFTILHMTVTNIGTVAQTLDDSSQFVYDSHGRKYTANSIADIDLNSTGTGGGVFFNSINPGNSVRGLIAFDLPAGDHAVKAELHDSAFSGGVTVTLP
jgi:uncharacterized protein DUF4352